MARIKRGTVVKKRHKRVLKNAKGYFGSKHILFKVAKQQVMKSWVYAYRDRKQKKREFRNPKLELMLMKLVIVSLCVVYDSQKLRLTVRC